MSEPERGHWHLVCTLTPAAGAAAAGHLERRCSLTLRKQKVARESRPGLLLERDPIEFLRSSDDDVINGHTAVYRSLFGAGRGSRTRTGYIAKDLNLLLKANKRTTN